MSKLQEAKDVILDAIIRGSDPSDLAEAYATLCASERDDKALDHHLKQKSPFETLKEIKESITREEIDGMFED